MTISIDLDKNDKFIQLKEIVNKNNCLLYKVSNNVTVHGNQIDQLTYTQLRLEEKINIINRSLEDLDRKSNNHFNQIIELKDDFEILRNTLIKEYFYDEQNDNEQKNINISFEVELNILLAKHTLFHMKDSHSDDHKDYLKYKIEFLNKWGR